MKGFDQKNSHHIYTLEEHCLRTACVLIDEKWKIIDQRDVLDQLLEKTNLFVVQTT